MEMFRANVLHRSADLLPDARKYVVHTDELQLRRSHKTFQPR